MPLCAMLKKWCGMLTSSVSCCDKIRKHIETEGHQVNSHDVYVSKKIMSGKCHALTWPTDDVKESHADSKVSNKFHEWPEKKHGSDKLGHVSENRRKDMTV